MKPIFHVSLRIALFVGALVSLAAPAQASDRVLATAWAAPCVSTFNHDSDCRLAIQRAEFIENRLDTAASFASFGTAERSYSVDVYVLSATDFGRTAAFLQVLNAFPGMPGSEGAATFVGLDADTGHFLYRARIPAAREFHGRLFAQVRYVDGTVSRSGDGRRNAYFEVRF